MAPFALLDQAEEDKLHATRLLGIEERPFRRLTKRLLAPTTPINSFLSRKSEPEEPAAEDADTDTDTGTQHEQFLKDIQRFREDVILDFAAFESSIARIQFLRAANERERERYIEEKAKIERTAEEVRHNTSSLRSQLDEAQKTLAIRKTYDVLADEITKNAALKPRDEQHVNIEKLKAEIEELERESQEHTQAWVERREQFGKVVSEGMRLRRVIRDEKEPEKDEDGAEQEDGQEDDQDQENMLGVDRAREGLSNAGTPRPMHDAPTPLADLRGSNAMTPTTLPEGGATPRRVADEDVDMDVGAATGEHAGGSTTDVKVEKAPDDMDTT
ncbi:Tho complex subunit 7-domain-containing protein [Exophiala viscosa]|uniref:Tho complex subunit 7-domain-containing protein n=1 Tax=Exophiala viscosa TaxID=2486360 RepID=UPI0021949378|nr:Tho complex subunit 7-domain-containing protein [Exophiala viscosa]